MPLPNQLLNRSKRAVASALTYVGLPRLSEQQKYVCAQLGISERAYRQRAMNGVQINSGVPPAPSSPTSKDAIFDPTPWDFQENRSIESPIPQGKYSAAEFAGGLNPDNVHEIVPLLPGHGVGPVAVQVKRAVGEDVGVDLDEEDEEEGDEDDDDDDDDEDEDDEDDDDGGHDNPAPAMAVRPPFLQPSPSFS